MDKFIVFTVLTADEQAQYYRYVSPPRDESIVKSVPMDQLDELKVIVQKLYPNHRIITRYRGPRRSPRRPGGTCLKQDAWGGSLYGRQKVQ